MLIEPAKDTFYANKFINPFKVNLFFDDTILYILASCLFCKNNKYKFKARNLCCM